MSAGAGATGAARAAALLLLAASTGIACSDEAAPGGPGGRAAATYDWGLPPGVPAPRVPVDNPMSVAKVELGRRLFHDPRLSGNQTYACASCHLQERAFTDGLSTAVGATGDVLLRGSMSLVNVGYMSVLTWGHPLMSSLEKQAILPMFSEMPVELGLVGLEHELLGRLAADAIYEDLFPAAFPEEATPISILTITRALAAFQRGIVSFRAPYDRAVRDGDPSAMSAAALRGEALFFSEALGCSHCHAGLVFSDAAEDETHPAEALKFHNTGLYNIGGTGDYPPCNTGVHVVTDRPEDMGLFRAPSLRNVAVTAPYMHDGSAATLDDVLAHYAAGGRTIAAGPHAGDGSKSPWKSALVTGFALTSQERDDVIAFLSSLTDEALLADPRFADPWPAGP